MSTTQPEIRLDRAEIAAADPTDQLADVLSIPEHLRDALWKAESADVKPWDSPGGLIVAGMGGSAIGGRLARAILGDQASRPVLSVARLRAAAVDDPGLDGPVHQLLGRHGGDARLLRGGRRARGGADRRDDRRRAGAGRARRGRPRHPDGRRAAAARRRRLLDRRRARGGRAVRRGPQAHDRDRRRRRSPRAARRRVGARVRRRERGQGAGARAARHRPRLHRRRAHARDRLPLEDAGQRERQAARVLERSCRSATTTRSSAGRRPRATAASAPSSSTTATTPRAWRSGSA